MANNLTGDYEAVLQVSVRQLNAILAALHQRRIDPGASPSFEHSASLELGERHLEVEVARFKHWAANAVQTLRSAEISTSGVRAKLSAKTPRGVSAVFERAWSDLDAALVPFAEAVRGKAYVQIGSPTLSFPTGVVSEVRVHARVRAHYDPYPGSEPLPTPIHGVVTAVYRVRAKTLPDGRLVLTVQVSPQDVQIKFESAHAGQSVADINKITAQVRKALRTRFQAVDVQLPPGFAFSEFKALGSGPSEAVVLPLQLSNEPFPAGGTASLTNHFLGSNEFAIAVSKEYFQVFFDQIKGVVSAKAAATQITATILFVEATYSASLSSFSVVWKHGAIDVSGKIDLVTSSDAPNGYIKFTQSIGVVLDVPSQTVVLKPLGDPDVDESWFVPHSDAVDQVKNGRDAGIAQATASVAGSFAGARHKLLSGLQSFDPHASVTYTALDVTPDGIIIRGAIGASGRIKPVVDVSEVVTAAGPVFTAWRSWIPGGWIQRLMWSWLEGPAWFGQLGYHDDADSFVLAKPAAVGATGRVCLQIEGTRLTADGWEETVTAGDSCRPKWSLPILVVPPWWFEANVPIWIPDPPPERPLVDAIAGHLNVVGGSRAANSLGPNTLVHFAGPRMERPLEQLSATLSHVLRGDQSLVTILVLPKGTFDQRRSEVEAKLGAIAERFAANNLLITEDYRGGWTNIFAAPNGPSTHLINALGELVWSQEGALDARALAAALEEHLLPAPAAHTAPLRLSVQPGERMPDTVFTDDGGNQIALRRLRGREVLLNFWQSWSAPCIQELRQLQRLQNQERPPLILAINGGEDKTVLADVRGRHNLTFPLIHDDRQAIATRFGVQCWPTTVSINREGIVDYVQFGLTHARPQKESRA